MQPTAVRLHIHVSHHGTSLAVQGKHTAIQNPNLHTLTVLQYINLLVLTCNNQY